jgi:serine/threonine-protein kinase
MGLDSSSLIGQQIDEYKITDPIASGGMAHVFRALDTNLERIVALKVIAPDLRSDPDYTARFRVEAQAIARLNHPSIVHVYRFGQTAGNLYYIAMQYVEGPTVRALIDQAAVSSQHPSWSLVLQVVRQIGEALDYAHSQGVIHRDVKASNIILSPARAVLTDFGLSMLVDRGTQGKIFGSPHYIAPEQAAGKGKILPQTDFYSLGVTLFEMLTGRYPFDGEDALAIALAHLKEQAPCPSALEPALPVAVDPVVLRCLEKEPAHRYSTGAQLIADLEVALGQRSPGPADSQENPLTASARGGLVAPIHTVPIRRTRRPGETIAAFVSVLIVALAIAALVLLAVVLGGDRSPKPPLPPTRVLATPLAPR